MPTTQPQTVQIIIYTISVVFAAGVTIQTVRHLVAKTKEDGEELKGLMPKVQMVINKEINRCKDFQANDCLRKHSMIEKEIDVIKAEELHQKNCISSIKIDVGELSRKLAIIDDRFGRFELAVYHRFDKNEDAIEQLPGKMEIAMNNAVNAMRSINQSFIEKIEKARKE